MNEEPKTLVIFGDSAFAEIAYEYFHHDSEYSESAFVISREYIKGDTLFDLPIIPFEDVQEAYPPSDYEMHIPLVYNKLNRNRMKFYDEAKQTKGSRCRGHLGFL